MDQKQIFELMEKFDKSRLGELKVETEGFKITLKSESAGKTHVAAFHGGMPVPVAPQGLHAPAPPSAVPSGTASGSPTAPQPVPGTEIITSPIVGTFYRSPAPDAPPYVEEGAKVKSGEAICLIEAMKIMNKLEADFSCEIVKILAENGKMVEYGSPLFEVKRT